MKRVTNLSVLKLWYVIQNTYLEWEKYGGQMIIIFFYNYLQRFQKNIYFFKQLCLSNL